MKSKNPKIATVLTALVMTFSIGFSANAESLLDLTNTYSKEDNSAILNYDPENNTYELVDGDGNVIETDPDYNNEQDPEETGTAVKSDTATVTEPPVKDSVTVATTTIPRNWYVARYREEVLSELAAITTVKPVITTVKTTTTVKVTTTKTTTKTVKDGIDVSRHQGTIDWTKVKKAGIDFVMIRAGYGMYSDQVDANFKTNIAGAQKAGIECGVYWYSYAVSTSEALKEAQVCYNAIKGYKLSYPVAFDIEDDSQTHLTMTQISNITKVFCDYLESKKYYVSVYSYASLLNTKMNSSVLSSYDIWVAHTGVSKPNFSGNYGMWQYSHTGKVNGISGNVDLNYGYKDYPGIIKKNKLNGYT